MSPIALARILTLVVRGPFCAFSCSPRILLGTVQFILVYPLRNCNALKRYGFCNYAAYA